ncbi:MAG: NmrA family NAD(P)-binding protein [Cyanobacteria bacterium J06627_32]
MSRILVSGATGRVGRKLVESLLRSGEKVNVLSRAQKKLAALQALGSNTFIGDLNQIDDVRAAMLGCDRLMSVQPNTLNQSEQEIQLFEVAKRAGIKQIVKLSTAKARINSECYFFQQHAVAERYLLESDLSFSILRSNSFMENFLWFAGEINHYGSVSLSLGDAKTEPVAIQDVVQVATVLLTRTEQQRKTYNVTGIEALSMREITAIISTVADAKIEYINVSSAEFSRTLHQTKLPAWYREAIVRAWEVARREQPIVTSVVYNVGEKQPTTFEQFIQTHKQLFQKC